MDKDMNRKFLITGAAGFIGSQLMNRLRNQGHDVIGLDNYNDHLYDPQLKQDRCKHFNIDVTCLDMRDESRLKSFLVTHQPTDIIHLAALAGVRDSMGNEKAYHSNNIDATQNLIDLCKMHLPKTRIVYASTSCVYAGSELPWTEGNESGKQMNAYGYTKWANECQFGSSGLHTIGLRFFTVYGPWGRPDMALFDFTKNILAGEEITIYNFGDMKRDFTYVEDILDGIEIILYNDTIDAGEVFNIGRGKQVELMDFVKEIEKNVGATAMKDFAPKHPADTKETWSNTSKLEALGYVPKTDVSVGIKNFYDWYKAYNGVQ